MVESESKRSYHSPRRQEQAQETRQKILAAAERLFASDGYAATTLPSVAREAGVSPATITVAFGTKPALLDALIKSTVRGDEAPEPLAQRSWWQEMLQEADPARQLRLFAAIGRRIHERTTDIAEIVRGAATADPEIALLRQRLGESRFQDNREVAESLARKGALDSGVTVEQATDLIWTLASADVYRMLVVDRGWSAERYEEWLASTLAHSIIAPLQPTC
jgi:AcrR family transcriptional regulator